MGRSTLAALGIIALTSAALLIAWQSAPAYVEAPMSLGAVVAQSSHIMTMRVEKVDKEKNLIIFRKVQDIKGKHPADVIKHNIGRGGFHPREWQTIMDWAEPGKTAVFCHNGGASETCIQNYWYQAYAGGEWWNMSHGEPYLLRSFAGNPEKLAAAVTAMLAGQEVVVPCMVDGDKNTLQLRTAKVQRLKASLKIQDYNAKRDFVGWGGEDFRQLAGMPPFSQYAAVTRVDPGARGIAPADFDGDGKADLCLYGLGRVVLLQNGGQSFNEVGLPHTGGARWAGWADYNGDKRPDLFLATPVGPKLFTNQGGSFKDDSALLPKEPYYNLTSAAWIDADGDGTPDLLLANGFLGLRLLRNKRKAEPLWFEDISDKVGLGPEDLAGSTSGEHLVTADFTGDGRIDFLYTAGSGLVALNTQQGFVSVRNAGLKLETGSGTPVIADFDGDKRPDIFVPHPTASRLWKNDGQGRFTDVTAKAGDLAKGIPSAAGAVAADFNGDGHIDLLVGCLRRPNVFLRNDGKGGFIDATESLGFLQRIFNTRSLAVLDLNKDGAPDLVLNNEGQESAILLGNPTRVALKDASTGNAP